MNQYVLYGSLDLLCGEDDDRYDVACRAGRMLPLPPGRDGLPERVVAGRRGEDAAVLICLLEGPVYALARVDLRLAGTAAELRSELAPYYIAMERLLASASPPSG